MTLRVLGSGLAILPSVTGPLRHGRRNLTHGRAMSVLINTNSAATMAANNLATSNGLLQRSLNRLSSGSKIVNPADDAGGLAVSMKLTAAARRQGATNANLGNAVSFLQSQDGALKVTGKVLERIGELKTLASDPTKNADDLANYNAEFNALQAELTSLGQETFNGIKLFGSTALKVGTTEDGTGSVSATGVELLGAPAFSAFSDNFADFSNWTSTLGSATTSSNMLLPNTGGGIGTVKTNQSFTGPMTINFDVNVPGTGDMVMLNLGSNLISMMSDGSEINRSNWYSVKVVVDDTGTASTYINGASTPAGTQSGIDLTGGQISLMNIGAGSGTIRNFSVTSDGATGGVSDVASAANLASLSQASLTNAISDVATYRAQNGASQSRLGFASEVLATNKANLEAANSRIIDVDVAEESTQLARYNVLVQAGTSMLAQANQSPQVALRLLG